MSKPEGNEFKEWKEHPITEWVFNEIEAMALDYAKALAEGASYDVASTEKTALKTAEAVGFIDGLKAIMKIELR